MSGQRVLSKAVTIQAGQRGGLGGSKQLPSDGFSKLYGEFGLVRPPYRLEQLLELKESNPLHAACIEQKSADIAGLGWSWVPALGVERPSDGQRRLLEELVATCNPELTFRELLQAAWDDYETLGWCALEVVPDRKGRPVELHHVPGHTLRAHSDRVRFAQLRDERLVWFKRFEAEGEFRLDTGEPAAGLADESRAGELIVIRKAGGRSVYYGIPAYISALGGIVGSLAVRDFNINWFSERTIPDALMVIEGADVSPELAQELKSFFAVDARGKHAKLCILPVPSGLGGEVRVRLERLMSEVKDASFRLYRQDNALEICIAHRVPPYRIGWPVMGSMAGSTAREMTEIYKRSVVAPGQELLEHRLHQQLFRRLFAPGELQWRWKLAEIDLTDQLADLEYGVKGVQSGVLTPNEARRVLGLAPYAAGDTIYLPNSLVAVAEAPAAVAKQARGLDVIDADDEETRDQAWSDFAALHRPLERELQKEVARFFGGRQPAP